MFKPQFRSQHRREEKEFEEKIVQIDRVTYVVAGGKRMRFRVLVVIGDKKGRVGYGIGKATEVPDAVRKAVKYAKKHLINVAIIDGTIAHEIYIKSGAAYIFLKPAKKGTSVIAGGAVRTVLELAGIKNVLSKILGSKNKINNVKAAVEALASLKKIEPKKQPEKPVKTNKIDKITEKVVKVVKKPTDKTAKK